MIALLASLALKMGVAQRFSRLAGWGLAAVGALLLIGGAILAWNIWLGRHDDAVIEAHENGIAIEVLTSAAAANSNAFRRLDDFRQRQAQDRREFDHATDHIPDRGLTDRQLLDLCRELRGTPQYQAVSARCGPILAGAASAP